MILRARELNQTYSNCKFDLIRNGPQYLQSKQYDLVYSVLLLQHLPSKNVIQDYVREFLRILKPNGLLIFQLPHHIPFVYKFRLQRRLYRLLRTIGFTGRFLHYSLGLAPISNFSVPQAEVAGWIEAFGAKLLEIASSHSGVIRDSFYYVTKK